MVSTQSAKPIVEVRGLVNRFGKQTVHDNLDLDIMPREVLGVVGGSGTGKSVLLRSIVGLRRPNAGSVKVFGQDLQTLSEEQRSLQERHQPKPSAPLPRKCQLISIHRSLQLGKLPLPLVGRFLR